MTSLVRAHSSEIDTCIFPENKVFFKNKILLGKIGGCVTPVICCGFPKSTTLFDRMLIAIVLAVLSSSYKSDQLPTLPLSQ